VEEGAGFVARDTGGVLLFLLHEKAERREDREGEKTTLILKTGTSLGSPPSCSCQMTGVDL
jgi:hypothetical protein